LGHDLYDRPGRAQAERQIGYRALFRDALSMPASLTSRTLRRTAAGARFKREIANALGRRVALCQRTAAQAEDAGPL
jgi:hypothetical protein